MSKEHLRYQKKGKKRWLLFPLFFIAVFFFHRPLLILGCKASFYFLAPNVSYQEIRWDEDRLCFFGIQFQDPTIQLLIDRIDLTPKRKGICFEPHIEIIHPQLLFLASEGNAQILFPFFYRNHFFSPSFEVELGILQLPQETSSDSLFYYSLAPGRSKKELGQLKLFHHPNQIDPSFFEGTVALEGEMICTEFKLQEPEISRILPFTAFVLSKQYQGWETARGSVHINGRWIANRDLELLQLDFKGSLEGLTVANSETGIAVGCEEFNGTFSYPASQEGSFFWDKLSLGAVFKEGQAAFSQLGSHTGFAIENLNGQLQLEPLEEPQLELEGRVLTEGKEIRFLASGKGSLQENETFWSVIDCECESMTGKKMQSVLSVCRHERDQDVFQLKIDHADAEHIDFFTSLFGLGIDCQQGLANGAMTWLFEQGICQTTSIDSCELEQMTLVLPSKQQSLFVEKLQAEGSILSLLTGDLGCEHFDLKLVNAEWVQNQICISKINAEVAIEESTIQTARFEGLWKELLGTIDVLQERGDYRANIALNGNAQPFFQHFFPAFSLENYPLAIQAQLKMNQEEMGVSVCGQLFDDPFEASASFAPLAKDFFSLPELRGLKFEANRLKQKSYLPFLSTLFPNWHAAGVLSCHADFLPSKLNLTLTGEELFLQHPTIEIHLPSFKSNAIELSYDFSDQKWQGKVPLYLAQLYLQPLHLSVEELEAELVIDNHHLFLTPFYAECQGLAMRGHLDIDIGKEQDARLLLTTSQIAGSAKNFFSVFSQFTSFPFPQETVDGYFSSLDQGFILTASIDPQGIQTQWKCEGTLEQIAFSFEKQGSIKNGHIELYADSSSSQVTMMGQCDWQLNADALLKMDIKQLLIPIQKSDPSLFAIGIRSNKDIREAYIEGTITKHLGDWQLMFNDKVSKIADVKIELGHLIFDETFNLHSVQAQAKASAIEFLSFFNFLRSGNLLPITLPLEQIREWNVAGIFDAKLTSQDLREGFSFLIKSDDLVVDQQNLGPFVLEGQKIEETWLIQKMLSKATTFEGAMIADRNGRLIKEHLEIK